MKNNRNRQPGEVTSFLLLNACKQEFDDHLSIQSLRVVQYKTSGDLLVLALFVCPRVSPFPSLSLRLPIWKMEVLGQISE